MRLTLAILVFTAAPALAQADAGPLLEDEEEEAVEGADPESEAEQPTEATDGGLCYTRELSDSSLVSKWIDDVASLGSISVGFAEAGRLVNGVQLPAGEAWTVVAPDCAWGTQETIDFLTAAAQAVREKFPAAPPLRVNHIGKREGGYLRPHQSHQSGRDVDLGFYYREGVDPGAIKGTREQAMDLAANWELVRALAILTDVQVILLDRRVQKVLYDYALKAGEDRAWLDSLFQAGPSSLLRHARRHRDHFHVRFYSARSQELGWRIQPLLARRPEENLVIHRVKSGETLGHLAMRYGSGVKLIQKANGLPSTALRVGRTLNIPLRGPCTKCPLPAQVVMPPRRIPVEVTVDGGTL